MNAHVVSYPSLQRRLMAERRARAFFLPSTTQHLRSTSVLAEIGRAAVAMAAATAWATVLLLFAV